MEKKVDILRSATGQDIKFIKWIPENPKHVLQIIHGMAEHIDRYDDFARYLCDKGFLVLGASHAGHDDTAEIKGYFDHKDGWNKLVSDIHMIRNTIHNEYPNLPYSMLGHSMGSFLLRTYLQLYSEGLHSAIICGTANFPMIQNIAGRILSGILKIFMPKRPSKLLNAMSFKGFNKSIENSKTDFDWLTRDDYEVKKYVDDPLCGFAFTNSAYSDMFDGLIRISDYKLYEYSDYNLPILFIAGDKDPVGNYGKGVKEVYENFKKSGFKNVFIKLYEGARHEVLNEINKEEVYVDVIEFLER